MDQAVVVCDETGAVRAHNSAAALFFPRLRPGEALSTALCGPLAAAAGRDVDGFEAPFEGRRLSGRRQWHAGRAVWLVRDISGASGISGTSGISGASDSGGIRNRAGGHGESPMSLSERADFLEGATQRLGGSLHHGRTARTLARYALPELADTALVVLPVRGRLTHWYRAGPGDAEAAGQVTAAALEDVPALADALSGLRPRPGVLDAGERDRLAAALPGELGGPCGDALVLQLVGNGVPAGALLLVREPGREGFGGPDVELARQLAARAAPALTTSALYSEQAHTTAVLQSGLAPGPLPTVAGVRLGAAYRPAAEALRISGDFYDVAPSPDGGVSFFFGDVCGKGAEAALLAGMVRQSLRTLELTRADALHQLRTLNALLLDDENRFTTLVTGSARPAPGGGLEVTAAGGGHLPPLVLRAEGRVEEIGIDGALAGILPEADFDEVTFHLGPGELVLLYSDGVTEARGGPAGHELYGDERLARDLSDCAGMPAGAVTERVELLITEWLGGRPHDDVAVLALQAPAPHAPAAPPPAPEAGPGEGDER
ncbi:PP2C family protein-serine/threonine phosphatase [Streptomyces daliensis]